MRLILRLLGFLFVAAALMVLGLDVWRWLMTKSFAFRPLGQVWFDLSPGSLNLVQAVIERYIWEPLYNPVLLTLLQQKASLVFAVLGLLLLWLGGWRRLRRLGR
jgi:hypothetical protein|tara:strand:- start:4730 stop:5041 length:312 start_codon:yes stop_codon:yes gene_type:complete